MKKIVGTKQLKVLLAFIFFLGSFSPYVYSRTVEDVEKDITNKKTELETVTTDITLLEEELNSKKVELENATGKRNNLAIQIDINKKEEEVVKRKLEDLKEQEELNVLEQEKRMLIQDTLISQSYVSWKQTNLVRELLNTDGQNLVKMATYQAALTSDEQSNIEQLETDLVNIQVQLQESEMQKKEYENRLGALSEQIVLIENELAALDEKINANQGDISNYRGKAGALQSQIDQLTKEQSDIQKREAALLAKASNGGTKDIIEGEIYFKGVGREIYQGHGVGMSQFGALGAALKGWKAEKIVEFYYPGAKIQTYKGRDTINVDGYGAISVEDYVAGAGEVPDYSCEELDIPFDNSNVWKCWPEEAIKAQVITFRSYGLAKTMDGSSICISARCQVYKGGEKKRWAAEETEYRVLMYDGKPATAFYSSDNHNGWGTANNDTIWSNLEGVGTPVPYLRAVNDSAINFNYTYTSWGWRTNSYTIEDLDEMLEWSGSSNNSSSSYKNFISGVKDEIGDLRTIEFERDPSGRVKRVKLSGENGSRYIAGWLFKSVWNIWIEGENPSGEKDYIYSLSYYMYTK